MEGSPFFLKKNINAFIIAIDVIRIIYMSPFPYFISNSVVDTQNVCH